jgi:hypothetical protein
MKISSNHNNSLPSNNYNKHSNISLNIMLLVAILIKLKKIINNTLKIPLIKNRRISSSSHLSKIKEILSNCILLINTD